MRCLLSSPDPEFSLLSGQDSPVPQDKEAGESWPVLTLETSPSELAAVLLDTASSSFPARSVGLSTPTAWPLNRTEFHRRPALERLTLGGMGWVRLRKVRKDGVHFSPFRCSMHRNHSLGATTRQRAHLAPRSGEMQGAGLTLGPFLLSRARYIAVDIS